MGAQHSKAFGRFRATRERRGLALDLTPDEVVLYEGSAHLGWRRFAGVALEDPEFLEVIGLLRAEAEGELGTSAPVRLWLPEEQVLKLSVRIDGLGPGARLRAAFREAVRATGLAAGDIAVAVGPPGPAGGMTTVLVTHAETWREARDHAARWGFAPGPVSTRHHADAFGASGPEFVLEAAADAAQDAAGDTGWRHAAWLAAWLTLALALTVFPWQTAAGRAPAAAPVPEARAEHTAPSPSGVGTGGPGMAEPSETGPTRGGLAVSLPRVRPPAPKTASGVSSGTAAGTTPAPLPPRAAQTEARPAAPSMAAAAASSGLSAPLPMPRPARAAPRATASDAALASARSSPFPVASMAAERGLPRDRAALVGILNVASGRKALLRLPGGDYRTVRVGDVLAGWRVSAIGVDAMRVSRGTETRTLLLVSR